MRALPDPPGAHWRLGESGPWGRLPRGRSNTYPSLPLNLCCSHPEDSPPARGPVGRTVSVHSSRRPFPRVGVRGAGCWLPAEGPLRDGSRSLVSSQEMYSESCPAPRERDQVQLGVSNQVSRPMENLGRPSRGHKGTPRVTPEGTP